MKMKNNHMEEKGDNASMKVLNMNKLEQHNHMNVQAQNKVYLKNSQTPSANTCSKRNYKAMVVSEQNSDISHNINI